MKGILADNNVEGQLEILLRIWESKSWEQIWKSLGLTVQTFENLELSRTCLDRELWKVCQENQILLLTANRNDEGPDSLESTIRDLNTLQSLPVITLGDATRITTDRSYARQTAEKTLEYILDMDKYYGAGRLYVP